MNVTKIHKIGNSYGRKKKKGNKGIANVGPDIERLEDLEK